METSITHILIVVYRESHHSCAFCLSPFGLHVDDTLTVFIFYVRISRILYALMYLPNRGNIQEVRNFGSALACISI